MQFLRLFACPISDWWWLEKIMIYIYIWKRTKQQTKETFASIEFMFLLKNQHLLPNVKIC